MLEMTISEALFTFSTGFCMVFDVILLICVSKNRFSNKKNLPFVYILFMSVFGLSGKVGWLAMVDAEPIANFLGGVDGYDCEW